MDEILVQRGKAMRKACLSKEDTKCLIMMHFYPYFQNIEITPPTPMRKVGNRK